MGLTHLNQTLYQTDEGVASSNLTDSLECASIVPDSGVLRTLSSASSKNRRCSFHACLLLFGVVIVAHLLLRYTENLEDLCTRYLGQLTTACIPDICEQVKCTQRHNVHSAFDLDVIGGSWFMLLQAVLDAVCIHQQLIFRSARV